MQLWNSLGLSATCTGITYDTTDDEPTNIYLEIDHPDKAASLISPPGAVTTSIEGVVCHLDYRTIVQGRRHRQNHPRPQQRAGRGIHHSAVSQPPSTPDQTSDNNNAIVQVEGRSEDSAFEREIDEMSRRRACTAQLAAAALYRMIGLRPRFFGVQGITPAPPTLLDVAPSMWNTHYMQVSRPL